MAPFLNDLCPDHVQQMAAQVGLEARIDLPVLPPSRTGRDDGVQQFRDFLGTDAVGAVIAPGRRDTPVR